MATQISRVNFQRCWVKEEGQIMGPGTEITPEQDGSLVIILGKVVTF